jgi:hypothetical protein
MTNEQRVIHIIKTTPALMTILQLIQDCHLKQGALAAGSIRNTVWQVLSGQPVMFNSDIDVVFFDPERPASDDLKIYQQLTDKAPQYQWQIKNEVYMAHYNFDKDPEFTSVTDAIGHFVEVPTCIGAFLDENQANRPIRCRRFDKLSLFPNPLLSPGCQAHGNLSAANGTEAVASTMAQVTN